MLDLSPRWPSVSLVPSELTAPGVTIRMHADISQHLISGDLDGWKHLAGINGDTVGALGLATKSTYAVGIARDRILVVNAPANAVAPGWHPAGFAVTDMSAALSVVEMRGEGVAQIISRATSLDPRATSASANCQFADVSAVIYRYGDRGTVRLHVERGFAPYVWNWLELNIQTAFGADA
jgi:heterotetrameric sarcosine oxidase gamma subunit